MTITFEQIVALEPNCDRTLASSVVQPLNDRMVGAGISTPLRVAHFMAQIAWESAHFHRMVESLNYSAERIGEVWERLKPRQNELAHRPEALANAAYGGRLGNGPEASGDGWRFRGRGLIQLTGRANYARFGFDSAPDDVALPHGAAGAAVDFWSHANCNALADADNVEGVTKAINGGHEGLEGRRTLTTKAKGIFR